MKKIKPDWAALGLALVSACLVLLIATTSSPLYATNFWTDTNIYFTIGRGMTEGLMPFRDLFDHKGPLLYMIYGAAALISDTSYLGVFMLQVLSLTAMLYLGYKTVSLFGSGALNLAAIPVTAIVTAASTAFNQGGSAEEFNLAALMLAVYAILRRMKEGVSCSRPERLYAAFGFAMGWVFLIKFTNCGLFFGLAFASLLYEWRLTGFKKAFACGLWCLFGMAVITVPVCLYLLMGGALGDCLRVYFYENIFIYGGKSMSMGGHIYNALAYLRTQSMANPVMAGLAMFGCAFTALHALWRHQKGFLLEAAAMPLGAGLLLLFTYWGEMAHPYYAGVFAALVPLGLCPLGFAAERLKDRRWGFVSLIPLASAAPICLALCAAVPLMEVKKADMVQTEIAQIVNETPDATLLDWSSLDQGFYLAAGITPTCRYFANNNLDSKEKLDAYRDYVSSGTLTYIITNGWQEAPGPNYELVTEVHGVFDLNSPRTYRLYRLRGER